MHLGACKHVVAPLGPKACAQEMLAFRDSAGRCHEQRKTEVGRGFGQHIGGVGALHTSRSHRVQVEIVVTHRHVGHDTQLRAGRQQRRINTLPAGGQRSGLVLQALNQLIAGPIPVFGIGFDREMLRQLVQDLRENGPCNKDGGFLHDRAPTISGTR